ncbi:MAG: FAD:protein FMN transferase [Cyclobacteriaceae bacterium]
MTKNRLVPIVYPFVLLLLVFIVWQFRKPKEVFFDGITMGVIHYTIKYQHPKGTNFQYEIDSLLYHWNLSMSTYIPDSEISRFNRDSCFVFESSYFLPVLESSRWINEVSDGAFDPTVGPLVDAWGFGPDKPRELPDSASVLQILENVGFHKINFDQERVCKERHGIRIDFSAIAKGYAVDVVADYLTAQGIENMMVEIGGEVVCKGKNVKGNLWRIGIEDPSKEFYEERDFTAIASVSDRAVATSGNYRNFKMIDGRLLVHTIDPTTGFPAFRDILSASVFAPDCMTADGFATAFMVLGAEKAIEISENISEIDVFLIYTGKDGEILTYTSEGIVPFIEIQNVEN